MLAICQVVFYIFSKIFELTIFDKYAKMLMVPDITVRRLLLERGGDGNDNIAVGIDFNSCIACQCYLSLLHNSE